MVLGVGVVMVVLLVGGGGGGTGGVREKWCMTGLHVLR